MKQSLLRTLKSELFGSIALIFLTALVIYGIGIPRLGYYYDDWYVHCSARTARLWGSFIHMCIVYWVIS
jgi:hypothetical protein